MSLELIKKYKIRAKKKLGQNFLVNDEIIIDISNVIDIKWKNIVEVWPWYWALTEKLILKEPDSLDLVELDLDMINILNDRIEKKELNISWINFKINKKDVLKYTPEFNPPLTSSLLDKNNPPLTPPLSGREDNVNNKYSVIANIPYYITSPILRHFLYNLENKPENMVILMQKDVWDKILWFPKNKSSVLSLIVEKKSNVSEKIFVSKENFIPSPKVESSVLLFEYHNLYKDISDEKFLKIIKIWFSAVRKKLTKNLEKWWYDKSLITEILLNMWYDSNTRWEDLDINDWCELVKRL